MIRKAEETKKAEKRFCAVKNVEPRWDRVFDSGDVQRWWDMAPVTPACHLRGARHLLDPTVVVKGWVVGGREEDVAG